MKDINKFWCFSCDKVFTDWDDLMICPLCRTEFKYGVVNLEE